MKRKTIDEIAEEATAWAWDRYSVPGDFDDTCVTKAARRAILLWSREQRERRKRR